MLLRYTARNLTMRLACSFRINVRILQHSIHDGYVGGPVTREVSGVIPVVNSLIDQRPFHKDKRISGEHSGEEFKSLSEEQALVKHSHTSKNVAPKNHSRSGNEKANQKIAFNAFQEITMARNSDLLKLVPSCSEVAFRGSCDFAMRQHGEIAGNDRGGRASVNGFPLERYLVLVPKIVGVEKSNPRLATGVDYVLESRLRLAQGSVSWTQDARQQNELIHRSYNAEHNIQ